MAQLSGGLPAHMTELLNVGTAAAEQKILGDAWVEQDYCTDSICALLRRD